MIKRINLMPLDRLSRAEMNSMIALIKMAMPLLYGWTIKLASAAVVSQSHDRGGAGSKGGTPLARPFGARFCSAERSNKG